MRFSSYTPPRYGWMLRAKPKRPDPKMGWSRSIRRVASQRFTLDTNVLLGSERLNSWAIRDSIAGTRLIAKPSTTTAGNRNQLYRLTTARIKAITARAKYPPRERLRKVAPRAMTKKAALAGLTQRSRS